jgi:hypothetical protein
MGLAAIIPLVGQLLNLGFKIADVIEKSKDVSDDDKEAMKAAITKAKKSVTYWDGKTEDGN